MTNRRGFTLIELLFATAIFSVSALALSSVLMTTISGNRLARQTSEATTLAQTKLEELRDSVSLPTSGSDTVGIYSRTWTVANANPNPGAYEATVTVNWTSIRARSVQLKTIAAR